ncbi:proteinaceous RNase P 1, chloroplastic/mitochondrial-like isoform X1 [Selaginella moellendorffii]|uniref:proteinaceous RNase P 1, chloroplastic/mitochondrial-like isoform X1 n=2 Tax=Selaginella moellendorffii TaxID=88036 RepID=UPI000D1CB241|nr:proteinaceous RNase P 1, chloroplastic/mitochondrial-like isoform X1 [Selaginella moellendorffii]|eukprot:XP_024519183.1 proteinaceous RNase P 1, chloroplastic/mitochondrial-like isoform X1 [Selaginella moellendorffii]
MRLLGFLASVAAAASFGRGRGRGRWQGGECGLYVHASTPSPTTCWSRGISVLNYIVPKKKKGVRPRFCLTRLKKRRIIGNLVKRSKRHTWTSKRRLAMEVDAVKQVEEEEKRRRRAVEDRPLLLQLRRQQQRAGRVRRILGEQRTFADKAADVYAELIRLRAAGKPLSQLSYDGIDRWFKSDTAAFAGQRSAEPGRAQVASALESNGSVFHGLGWLGRGRWNVHTTTIDDAGVCRRCHEQLSTYKTDAQEADKFARHMVNLASKSVHRLHFDMFSDWMHLTSYDAILDGLSLRRCNVDSRLKLVRSATFHDILKSAVEELRMRSLKFLVVLDTEGAHANGNSPVAGDPKLFLYQLKQDKELYTVPKGVDSTWLALYAAMKHGCMLLTNDTLEKPRKLYPGMFLPKWMERHQVRFDLPIQLSWPPAYSVAIQESLEGSWHVPSYSAHDLTQPRPWLCITRPRKLVY